MQRRKSWSFWGMALMSGVMLIASLTPVQAAVPAGTLKEAIHWGLSADWLDPATNSASVTSQITLYLFHDALFKPMPDGTYSPCLAE